MGIPKRIPALGLGSSSISMGSTDPRGRRNAQAPLGSIDQAPPFGVDDKGRKTLRDKAAALDPSTATVADIIRVLQDAGLMER